MRIAVVQHEIEWEAPKRNFAALEHQITEAASTGAGLIVLTETFSWGFSMNTGHVNEPHDGPSTQFLLTEAARTGAWIVGSIPVRPVGADRPYNRMTFAGPAGELETYDKIHPFTFSGEDKSYRAGTRRKTLTIGDLRITAFVCFDLRFADEFWDLARETDCYVIVANWPASRRTHWQHLLLARAIENQAWVVASNRVGSDPNVDYAGDSMIIDPFGEIVEHLPEISGVISADVDPRRVDEIRTGYPFLEDRR